MILSVRAVGWAALALFLPLATGAIAAQPGAIRGRVLDADDRPVPAARVAICDQATGIPLAPGTSRPFTDGFAQGRESLDLAHAVTDPQGRFVFDKLPAGTYRLVCQSWSDVDEVKALLEVNGKQIELHGVVDNVRVPSAEAEDVLLRPLGTGTLVIDQEVGNDETLLVVSTAPTRADPILGFAGWGGPFLQRMIGGNRMPRGETTVRGLPEGKVYLAVFAADNSPGFGAGEATIRAGRTTFARLPFVAGWSNAQHDPPARLAPLVDEWKRLSPSEQESCREALKAQGIDLENRAKRSELLQRVGSQLNRKVELPSGTTTTIGDFLAATAYVDLQQFIERRQTRRRESTHVAPSPEPDTTSGVSYERALADLYDELARNDPCFELKGIDWKAVGEQLLPRAKVLEAAKAYLWEGEGRTPAARRNPSVPRR